MVTIRLKDVIGTAQEKNFTNAISKFTCKDKDVEHFLSEKAAEHEKRNKSRTYLIMDEAKIKSHDFLVAAYFTLSLKALNFKDSVSKTKIKDIDGFSKTINAAATILIGQFGKDELVSRNIDGAALFDICIAVVYQVHNLIGSRVALIECQNIDKIVDFYKKNGFEFLQYAEGDKYLQMTRRL
jgi:hypothetical protein